MPDQNTPTPRESALHAHVHAVLAKLEEVKTFALEGLKKIGGFIVKEAPVVEATASAAAAAIPGVGPVAGAVVKAAEVIVEDVAKVHSLADVMEAAQKDAAAQEAAKAAAAALAKP